MVFEGVSLFAILVLLIAGTIGFIIGCIVVFLFLKLRHNQELSRIRTLFRESEKTIRKNSVSSSRRSLIGKFVEKFIPFIRKVKHTPSDMHFLGSPVDYIVFEGLESDDVKKIIFLEVKSGKSALTKREKSLKKAVNEKKVYWEEIRIDTPEDYSEIDESITKKE